MARITVEDCLPVIANPFELVIPAADRARDLARCALSDDPEPDHKATVTALRDLASRRIDPHKQREALIRSLIRYQPDDAEPVEEGMTDEAGYARMQDRMSRETKDARDAA
jgi:DNA-directed RNA polymerase subunit omega